MGKSLIKFFNIYFRFYDAAKVVSHSFNHRPQQALHTAIWWVEHVAHTGGAPLLKPSAVEMSRFVYYSLDCYALVAGRMGKQPIVQI